MPPHPPRCKLHGQSPPPPPKKKLDRTLQAAEQQAKLSPKQQDAEGIGVNCGSFCH